MTPRAFSRDMKIRFSHCDPAGIVYFPTIYHYCHVAFEDAWRVALGTPYSELVARHRLGFPTVHVESDFVTPLRYGDVVTIRRSKHQIRLLHPANSSFFETLRRKLNWSGSNI